MSSGTNTICMEVFVLGPLATNSYLVYDEPSKEGILIDPATPSAEIRASIKDKGINVKFIVNTHGHADHIMGNSYFGYPVMVHRADEEYLADPTKNLSAVHSGIFFKTKADKLLKADDIIELGESKIRVIHTPGHTPGGISLLVGEMLFSGDTLFFEGVGRTDLVGGSTDELFSSIKELMKLDDNVKVYPGHGPETTIGHERKHNPFFM